MHTKLAFHKDVKPSNIFLTSDWQVRVGDLGASCDIKQVVPIHGTEQWMAPEVRLGKGFHPTSDVYGIGFLTYFIIARRNPYELKQDWLINYKPDKANSGFGCWMHEVMHGCMRTNTEDRLSFKEIKKVVMFWLFKVYCESNDKALHKKAEALVRRLDFDISY